MAESQRPWLRSVLGLMRWFGMDASDPELLRQWIDGDESAGRDLVRRHFATVFGFCRRRAPHRAEDLTQQTFLAAHRRLDSLRKMSSFRAFLLGVAHYEILRSARDVSRRLAAGERLAGADPGATITSPSRPLHMKQEQRMLLAALKQLPPKLQLTVELHYWEELSTQEIADVLETPVGTVKWRLSEARRLLRKTLLAQAAPAPLIETTITNLDAWARSLRDLIGDGVDAV